MAASDPSSILNSAMPWGAAIGAVGQVLSAPPAGPSGAKAAGSIASGYDNSGWTVTYGDNSGVDAVRNQSAPGVSASGGSLSEVGDGLSRAVGGALGAVGGNMQYVLLAVGAVVLLKVLKRRRQA